MRNSNTYARTGAVFYMLWGLLHLYVAYDQFSFANQSGSADVRARLQQLASYIGTGALAAIVIAVIGNWRNQRLAYWLNLGIVSIFEKIVRVKAMPRERVHGRSSIRTALALSDSRSAQH